VKPLWAKIRAHIEDFLQTVLVRLPSNLDVVVISEEI